MKIKELIKKLQELPENDDIFITAMDDRFFCTQFEVASKKDGEAQEIIMNVYIDNFEYGKDE